MTQKCIESLGKPKRKVEMQELFSTRHGEVRAITMPVTGGEETAGEQQKVLLCILHETEMELHSSIPVCLNYSICRTSIKSIFPIILSITANTTLETQEFLVALYIGSQLLMMIRICINNQLVIYKWQMSGRTWNQILKNVICCFTLQVISITEEITAYDADI